MSDSRLLLGDCFELLRELGDASIDAVVTDPPYGISFMGKHWDRFDIERRVGQRDVSKLGVRLSGDLDGGARRPTARTASAFANAAGEAGDYDVSLSGNRRFQEWCCELGGELLRVLKPGGHALVFGGTRTHHRMTAGLEDAGFEIRDELQWLFGSGFPKSLNLDGEYEGWGTALKPGHEPIVLARKPLAGTVSATVFAHGTGALNIAGCRIGFASDADERESREKNQHADFGSGPMEGNTVLGTDWPDRPNYDAEGRWPANVVLDGEAAALLDEQTGELTSGAKPAGTPAGGRSGGIMGARVARVEKVGFEASSGGASRFFYCEREPDYMAIAEARIGFWRQHGERGLDVARSQVRDARDKAGQLDLLGDAA